MTELNRIDHLCAAARWPLWTRFLRSWAERLVAGQLTLVFPEGERHSIIGHEPGPAATIEIHRRRMFRRLIFRGGLGFAESFIDGEWSASDLVGLMEFGIRTKSRFGSLLKFCALLARVRRPTRRLRANTRAAAAANIAYHYDLGNGFYAAWLDQTMTYSSALFTRPDLSLYDAQREKYRRIVEVLQIVPSDRVLEIGCGWGGFAEYAARQIGCHVTGITLSREQAEYARERLRRQALGERTDIRLQDYRDAEGSYEKIVSIEMFEAVGEEYWPLFFELLRERLAPGGMAALQIITITDASFPAYRRRIDFIQRYIFPGGMLPSPAALASAINKASLKLNDSCFFGPSYATTLAHWNARFQRRWHEIAEQGFDERFRRMWTYYLACSEASFRTGRTDVGQFVIARA